MIGIKYKIKRRCTNMLKEKLENVLLSDIDMIADVVREINSYSGALEFLEVYDMEEFDYIVEGLSPLEIASKTYYGKLNPNDSYFRYDSYSNFESLSSWEVEDEYRNYISEIVDRMLEVKDNICLSKELQTIMNVYDFLCLYLDEEEEE
jgi:hypothetical protein